MRKKDPPLLKTLFSKKDALSLRIFSRPRLLCTPKEHPIGSEILSPFPQKPIPPHPIIAIHKEKRRSIPNYGAYRSKITGKTTAFQYLTGDIKSGMISFLKKLWF